MSEDEEYQALLRGEMSSREWARRLKARCFHTHDRDMEYIRQRDSDNERLREAAREVIADWDRNPEFEPVSGEALRRAAQP